MAETSSTPSFFFIEFLQRWDREIRHASNAAAKRIKGTREDAEDFAQEARIRLVRLAARPQAGVDRYVRRVVANAIKTAITRTDTTAFEEIDAQIEAVPPDEPIAEVTAWTEKLPPRLRAVYQHLYVDGRTQRETAHLMDLTQPRIAQMHRQLLDAGRRDLQHLA